jgi:hypothetical protein
VRCHPGGSGAARTGRCQCRRRSPRVPLARLHMVVPRLGLSAHPHMGRLVVSGHGRGLVSVPALAMALETGYLVRISLVYVEARPSTDPDPPRPGGRAGVRGRRAALLLDHPRRLVGHDGRRLGQRDRFRERFPSPAIRSRSRGMSWWCCWSFWGLSLSLCRR